MSVTSAARVATGQNATMAEDEIERLLREVEQSTARPSSPVPTGSPAPVPAKPDAATGVSRVAFAGGGAVVLGVLGWVAGILTPFTSAPSVGLGAAVGAFVMGLVAGPPKWLSR